MVSVNHVNAVGSTGRRHHICATKRKGVANGIDGANHRDDVNCVHSLTACVAHNPRGALFGRNVDKKDSTGLKILTNQQTNYSLSVGCLGMEGLTA